MQFQRQSLVQNQKFAMNPQIFQSIKLMELPIIDLRGKIEEELERNPALEVLKDPATVSLDAAPGERKEEEEYFESSSDSGFVGRGGEAASDEQRSFIEGSLARSETLQEHLLWQLRLEPVDDNVRRIAELLIQNLTEDGFHSVMLELLLKNVDPALVSRAQKIVQALDPAGTCTCDYMESLKVQIGFLPDPPDGIVEALSYLEQLERGRIAETAKILGRTEEEMRIILEKIKGLFPFPGRRFSSGEIRYVLPDVQVIKKEEGFAIILNQEEIPVLGINPFFMKVASDSAGAKPDNKKGDDKENTAKAGRDFARENIKEARWFINCINQRNHTLLRVTRAILEFQRPFFSGGPKYISPLTLSDIAGELGIHETTVSRTANGKYVQCEWGIFELRYFFTNSITGTGSGGSKYSKEGVKEIIREIIGEEQSRLSDQNISDLLAKRGINLARRTVAKYRGELDLGSSFERN